jgi:hypothetical protein
MHVVALILCTSLATATEEPSQEAVGRADALALRSVLLQTRVQWDQALALAREACALAPNHGPALSALGHAALGAATTGKANAALYARHPDILALARAVRAHLKRSAVQGDIDPSFVVQDLLTLATAAETWGDLASAFDCLTWAMQLMPLGDSPLRRTVTVGMGTSPTSCQ